MIYLWQILVRRILRDVSLAPLLYKMLVTKTVSCVLVVLGCKDGQTNYAIHYTEDCQQEQKR